MARKTGSNITALLEAGSVERLLEAWHLTRATEIADALDRAPLTELDEVITGSAVEGLARLTRIPEAIDPRIAGALVRWLADPPWHATSAKPFYQQLFKRLGAIADPRGRVALPAARKAVQRVVKGKTMRGWLVEQIDQAIAALRAADAPTELSVSDLRLVARAGKALAKAPPVKRQASKLTNAAAELLAAIRANPADDGARQVYADVLSEKSDPRGELITMQLARANRAPTKDEAKRELELLTKHVRIWLGELGAVVGPLWNLAVGPEGDESIRFDRGFLAGCALRGSRNKIATIAEHPDLATVEELELDFVHGHLVLASAELPALAALTISATHLATLLARPAAARVKTLTLWDTGRGEDFITDLEACAQLPALRTLKLKPDANRLDAFAIRAVCAALTIPQLETVRPAIYRGEDGDFVRSGKTWKFLPSKELGKAAVNAYRALL